MKHTPGPWHIGAHIMAYGDKGQYYPIETTEGEIDGYIARVYVAGKPTAGQGYSDALLIAMAPLLLETLKECITEDGARAMTDESRNSAYTARQRLDAITTLAKAAIAKAEGTE